MAPTAKEVAPEGAKTVTAEATGAREEPSGKTQSFMKRCVIHGEPT